jgi:hypothetical protein
MAPFVILFQANRSLSPVVPLEKKPGTYAT